MAQIMCYVLSFFLLGESTRKSGFYLNQTITLGSYILPLALINSGE